MSLIANKTALMFGTESGGTVTYAQITSGSETLCINEYPDLGNEQPDQIEITTLCDDAHKFMDGLKNLPDELAFPCNYSEVLADLILNSASPDYKADNYWAVYFGDNTGKDGKFTFKATARLVVNGASSGDLRTMTLYLKPTTEITFAKTA